MGPAVHMAELKPPLSGVHFRTPPEYIPLQHPFLHWEFEEHIAQSPSDPAPVGGEGGGGVGVGPAVHMAELKPPLSGVHFRTPPEYMPLQHPFLHWEFEEHIAQSPSVWSHRSWTDASRPAVGMSAFSTKTAPTSSPTSLPRRKVESCSCPWTECHTEANAMKTTPSFIFSLLNDANEDFMHRKTREGFYEGAEGRAI